MSRQARLLSRPFKASADGLASRTAIGVCLFVCAMSANATPVEYLQVPGVTGPVDTLGFSGAFDVDSFSFGGGSPVATLSVAIPSAEAGSFIPDAGRAFPLVYLDVFSDTPGAADYSKYTLGETLVTEISAASGGAVPEELIVFEYARVSVVSESCNANGVTCPSPPSVPEPDALALLSVGLFGASLSRRRLTH